MAGKVVAPIFPKPDPAFIWNAYLTAEYAQQASREWVVHVVHGFVGQSHINVHGHRIYVTLIARRSQRYAGPRFLKRGEKTVNDSLEWHLELHISGCNDAGDVANFVETEQIVHSASTLDHASGQYTSYVQLRGSVPCFWSQVGVVTPVVVTRSITPSRRITWGSKRSRRYTLIVRTRLQRRPPSILIRCRSLSDITMESHIVFLAFCQVRYACGDCQPCEAQGEEAPRVHSLRRFHVRELLMIVSC